MSMFVAVSTRTMRNAIPVHDEGFRRREPKARPRPVQQMPIAIPARLLKPRRGPVLTPQDAVDRVIDLVARMHGVEFHDVMGDDRHRPIAHARQAAVCALAAFRPKWSLTRIGKRIGLDHSTCLHAMERRGYQR